MFAFKWLCTSTDSRSAPCNHILWAPARTLQNTWFLRVSRFHSRACKKWAASRHGYSICPRYSSVVVFASGILMDLRCRSLREGICLFRLLPFFFLLFFIATQQREQSCQNVCQENSVWEYREGSSAGSCMLFRVGQRRRAGSKTRLIAVLTEIHKRDRSYQA